MDIKRYCMEDEPLLFNMLKEEGDDWIDYHWNRMRTLRNNIG